MGYLASRKLCLLLIIISSLLISSTSFAGRQSRFLSTRSSANEEFVGINEESPIDEENKEENFTVHERMLRQFTNDYGRYNPSPSFRRPRHKLIPN